MMHRLARADWILFGSIFFLGAMSLITLASLHMEFFWQQLLWWAAALVVFAIGAFIDWRWFASQRWFANGLYIFSVFLIVFSYFQSNTIRGTKSWIVLGSFQFQPVELMKLSLILVLAAFFSRRYIAAWQGKNIFMSLLIAGVPGILVAAHPDIGSAAVIFMIWVGFLVLSGIHIKRFLWGLSIALFGVACLWIFVLKPYQKDRITAFIFPERDPLGINYNVIQSKIAIGSAGFLGKGFKGGTQAQLDFLPEAETDFIFASFTEEWGFLGGLFVLFAYFLILWRFSIIGARVSDNFSKFLVLGGIIVFFTQLIFNVGSNLGLVPVTGITLPFFSYGGSSLLTVALLVSIIHSTKLESSV